MSRLYVVLYFIKGPAPSDEQRQDAYQYGPNCRFRNSLYVAPDTPLAALESCVAVAGHVPMCYARAYPQAVSFADFDQGALSRLPMAVTAGLETADDALARLGLPGDSEPSFDDEPAGAIDMPIRPPAEAGTQIERPAGPVRRATNKGRGAPSEGDPQWQRNA